MTVLLAAGSMVYFADLVPWLATAGRIAREAGWVTNTGQALALAAGILTLAAAGATLLDRWGEGRSEGRGEAGLVVGQLPGARGSREICPTGELFA